MAFYPSLNRVPAATTGNTTPQTTLQPVFILYYYS